MATADNQIPQRRLSTGEVAASYPPGGVPSTPMEFRQGPHPKKVSILLEPHLYWLLPAGLSDMEDTSYPPVEPAKEKRV